MTTRRVQPRLRAVVASLLVAGITLAACGDDDDDTNTEETTAAAATDATDAPATTAATATTAAPVTTAAAATTAAPATTATPATTGGDAAGTVEVVLTDFAFGGIPESVPAGTKFTILNNSKKELHEMVAIRIPDEETRPVSELVTLPEKETSKIFGDAPPAFVMLAPPGGEQINALGDGTVSEPGRYAVVCFIPTGADPQEYLTAAQEATDGPPQVAGGPPHVVHGMFAELTVE